MFLLVLLLCYGQRLDAYDVLTHQQIAERAADPAVSSVDLVLKQQLGLPSGVAEKFRGREVREWIGEGAGSEDVPVLRVVNRFHNPLLP